LESILIPRNTLVVLCGPAACGKSTFAAAHFLPTQVVSSDECRALVSDDAANQGVSHHAFDLMHFIIEKRLGLGRLTVCDATNLRREHRKVLLKMARAAGFNAAAVVFDLRLETCLARNAARSRVVPQDALEKQFEMLEETRRAIKREGFDFLFFLTESDQDGVAVKVGRALRREHRPPARGGQI
jgi:predicted kinase